tara:strand:+ start:529 stop:1443 length:915 start_codon:yes stop_codon:yes gene_type:complete
LNSIDGRDTQPGFKGGYPKLKNILAILCVAVLACGCASVPELTADEQLVVDQFAANLETGAVPTGKIKIVDERDPKLVKTRLVPVGIAGGFSCFIGITRLGPDFFAADRVTRLENAVMEAYPGLAKENAELIVRRYEIFLNRGAEANAQQWNIAVGGVVGALIGSVNVDKEEIWREPRCDSERMHSGWFDPADLNNNLPPITVEVDMSLLGRDYKVNAAHSPELYLERLGVLKLEDSPAFAVMVQRTEDKVTERLIELMSADLATMAPIIENEPETLASKPVDEDTSVESDQEMTLSAEIQESS